MQVFMKNISFRRLMYSNILNNLGTAFFSIVFLIYASKMPNPKLAVSAVSIIGTLPFLTDVVSGYLADHTKQVYNKILLSRLSQVVLFLILSFFIGMDRSWTLFGFILILNFVCDFLGNYGGYLTLPIFKHIVNDDDMAEANGFVGGTRQSIELIGGMLGASLLALLNQSFVFFAVLNAMTFLLSFLIFKFSAKRFAFSRPSSQIRPTNEAKKTKNHFIQDVKNNFQNLKKYPQFFHFTVLFALMNFMGSAQEVLVSLTMLKVKNLIIFNYGFTIALIGAVMSGGIILGSFFTLPILKKISIETSLVVEMLFIILFMTNMVILNNRFIMLGSLLLGGYMMGVSNPKIQAFMMKIIPDEHLGTVMSSFNSLITITIPLGSIVAASLGNLENIMYAWMLFIAIGAFGFVYSLKLLKNYRTFA
ncbi:MFS transporter [Fructilactobacillus frigidiflavus]|uniref:MFS transporter n=1 Tax=Fructilactobacillus frigidiflavus TaxID=3242688 RepID=UPI003756E71D